MSTVKFAIPLERQDRAYRSPAALIRRIERKALYSERLSEEDLGWLRIMAEEGSQPLTRRLARILLDPDQSDPMASSFRTERLAVTLDRLMRHASSSSLPDN